MAKSGEEVWNDEFDDCGDDPFIAEEDEFSDAVDKDFAASYANLPKPWARD